MSRRERRTPELAPCSNGSVLSALQAENEKLREMYQKEKAVCHAVQAELEQVKRERGAAIEAANGLDKMIGRAWGED